MVDLLLREEVVLPNHPLKKFMEPADIRPRTAPPGSAEQTFVGACMDDQILGLVESVEGHPTSHSFHVSSAG
jgi:hypothetical protein